ncbi:hypothetical protein [Priestia megaterium]|uniref:hypothetical protein n=1 Tax=Priestia megaterium TaxID=1404 RepID=UPI000D51799E|nr:hypothetical protein [Priestia megaterium]PVE63620.1 hypothetical protein DC428_24410 [Priestia megaterium]PVE84212.1 hypothetical protein DC421_12215 [Priestia megaterium]PVE91315.1 hypothetical protein DC426_10175 [Priestia megaterium]PVE97757.1 hypothetical protein DC433_17635 [Priestia megaterium]
MKNRMKTVIGVIVGVVILIGAIWLINETRYPNVPAFDDHFTRKFLNKDKKADNGFYEFKSKTDQYTMWFPEKYQVLHKYREDYTRNGESYENWSAAYIKSYENDQQTYAIKAEFSENDTKSELIYVESLFEEQLDSKKPKQLETSNTRIYYDSAYTYFHGTNQHIVHDSKENPPNLYVAYVADKSSDKVIKLIYDSVGENTETNQRDRKKWFLKMLQNIKFVKGN